VADYLDSLIARSREATPVLQPRVARLFEPVPPDQFPTAMPVWAGQVPLQSRAPVADHHSFPQPAEATPKPNSDGASERRPEPTDNGFAAAPGMPEPAPQAHEVEYPYTQSLGARLRDLERRLVASSPVSASAPLPPAPSSREPSAQAAAPPTLEPALPRITVIQRTIVVPEDADAALAGLSPPAARAPQEAPVRALYATPRMDRLQETERAIAALRPAVPPAARAAPAPNPAVPVSSDHALPPRAVPLSVPGLSPPAGLLLAEEREKEPVLVNVIIGRVEVRAPPAPAQPKPARADAAAPTSLDDYLRRRNGDRR
jgi:hypothetical protein